MGWAIGYDQNWDRDIGYGVPAECDHPDCKAQIDRGLSYVCGGEPYGGEIGCGLFFCDRHLGYAIPPDPDADHPDYDEEDAIAWEDRAESTQLCERCEGGDEPFEPKRDVEEWILHKLTDPTWGPWRKQEGGVYLTLADGFRCKACTDGGSRHADFCEFA